MHVTAGTKRTAGACDDYRPNFIFMAKCRERVRQLAIDFKRQRVQTLGAIERDGCNALAQIIKKSFGFDHNLIEYRRISGGYPTTHN